MQLHFLPLADDADRRALRFATALCLAAAAVLALSAFAFAEIVSGGQQVSASAPSMTAASPSLFLPTVPQASDVLPAGSPADEPQIATYGG